MLEWFYQLCFPLFQLLSQVCVLLLIISHNASGSHLDLPRLSFKGQVRVDAATGNNAPCNFHPNEPIDEGWNFQGTGEFSLFNCRVTSAIGLDGEQPLDDAVMNGAVLNNIDEPYAKAVDFDVQLMLTTVYGLTLSVIGADGEILIQGRVMPFVLGQDTWRRDIGLITNRNKVVGCYPADRCLSAKSASVISNIKWGKISVSPTLQGLKEASDQQGGKLSLSLTVYSYISINPYSQLNKHNDTLGHLIGTIGPPNLNEPVLIAGERMLSYEGVPQPHLYDTRLQNGSRPNALMYNAPFQINHNSLRLSVDFSNSISLNGDGNFVFLGELWLGVQDQTLRCVHLIGEPISYLDKDWVHKGCIHDHVLSKYYYNRLLSSPLYVFQVRRGLKLTSTFLHSCSHKNTFLQPMLQEIPKFIRPMGNYLGKLEYKQTMKVELKVTQYGQPLRDQAVYVSEQSLAIPQHGIIPIPQISTTNEQGIATVIFHAVKKISLLRKFPAPETPCNRTELPIEGQLYTFEYFLSSNNDTFRYANIIQPTNMIAFLAFSYFKEPKHPNWIEHIQPIFQQYERLFPAMKHVVNLGNYIDVTTTRNLHLIDYTMGLDIDNANHMPVTRDLSPSKRAMIQKWLRQKPKPRYSPFQNELENAINEKNTDICVPLNISYGKNDHDMSKPNFLPERCLSCQSEIEPSDNYFQHLYTQTYYYLPITTSAHHRPLIRVGVRAQFESCTLQALREQLQTAVELEFYTIPVYLTSLYSIVDGCNREIHNIILYVVKQEMQHMTHAANILTAIGGRPIIDRSDVAPSYPAKGLPGGVLPNLVINLERLSREHVYRVFMGIEVPHDISMDTQSPIVFNNTIGQFYKEISDCIDFLGNDIFISSEAHKQVVWPWVDHSITGGIHTITDTATAKKAISEIIEQGEGASPIDPTVKHVPTSEHNIAHFYKFEEIVCERQLVMNQGSYCYSGPLIPYDPSGVWPMQSNPSKDKIRPNTNCYTQTKAFHGVYRALLRRLQEVLDGHREGIKEAIAVMESLGLHARLVMQTRLQPHEETTCGPVWDYDWD